MSDAQNIFPSAVHRYPPCVSINKFGQLFHYQRETIQIPRHIILKLQGKQIWKSIANIVPQSALFYHNLQN